MSIPKWFAIVFGGLAAGTLVAQILTAGPNATPVETALFSVLQFVFSIAFAWLMTGLAAKREFMESQKAFAVAAYRRIHEINEGIERLLARSTVQLRAQSPELQREAEVMCAIAMGVRSSIKSSIADWGDIIGDEITTIGRIERIKDEQEVLLELPRAHALDAAKPTAAEELRDAIGRSNEQIAKLLATLPPSLRLVAGTPKRPRDPLADYSQDFETEEKETGTIRLRGFWEHGLDRDIQEISIGDPLTIKASTLGDRVLCVAAYDTKGESVGIMINSGGGPYYLFREALISYFHSTEIPMKLTRIDGKKTGNRRYFEAEAAPPAFATRLAFIEKISRQSDEPKAPLATTPNL
jgi:hypothetical protein